MVTVRVLKVGMNGERTVKATCKPEELPLATKAGVCSVLLDVSEVRDHALRAEIDGEMEGLQSVYDPLHIAMTPVQVMGQVEIEVLED